MFLVVFSTFVAGLALIEWLTRPKDDDEQPPTWHKRNPS